MARQKAGWGEARTAIAVVIDPYLDQIKSGTSVSKIYKELTDTGKAEGFSRDALYHFIREWKKSSGQRSRVTKKTSASASAPSSSRPLLPPKGSILPASPVSPGEGNGNALMLGEDGTD